MSHASVVPVQMGTLRRITLGLPYFQDWTIPQLKAIVSCCRLVSVAQPQALLQLNGVEPFAYFLIRGEVTLETPGGDKRSLQAGELDAGFPLAQRRTAGLGLIALPGAELLRIEASKLRGHQALRTPAQFILADDAVDAYWRDHPLVSKLIKKARASDLALPAMPGIAVRVRKALARVDFNLDEIVAIVSADPAIVARLLNIANSALFRGYSNCDSIKAALMRLGVEKAQQIVMSLATRDLFVVKNTGLKTIMIERWRHAIDIAALCAVLAKRTPGLQSDKAMLVGLLHEIGCLPLLQMVESYPDLLEKSDSLREIMSRLTPELSALVLDQWGFEPDFITAAQHQNHWFRDHDGPADYTDVLIIAHLHALVHLRSQQKLPRIDEVPAFEKLALGQLSPRMSLQVLDEAKAHIQELKTLLA